jgi:hypothetical protein
MPPELYRFFKYHECLRYVKKDIVFKIKYEYNFHCWK